MNEPKHVKKSKAYLTTVPSGKSWNTLTTIDKDAHRVNRKGVFQSFTNYALRTFEPAVQKHVDSLHPIILEGNRSSGGQMECQTMHEKCKLICTSSPRDADVEIPNLDKWLTLDSLCRIGFGRMLNLSRKPRNRFVIDALHPLSSVIRVYVQFPEPSKLHLEKLLQ